MTRLAAVLTAVWLVVMLAWASPRNVGDASEYLGMAIAMARLGPPALSDDEMEALTHAYARTPAAFELETRRIPEMRGPDGRYDMPHMWLYPLLAVPGVWIARAIGASPAWAFVALNAALLGGLLWLAIRRGAGAWTLVVAASPVVWWIDKPLADLFVAAALGSAVLLWPRHGPVSLVVLGIAAAQNPALAVPCVIFAGCAVLEQPGRLRDRRWWAGAALGAACASVAPAYYLWRLDRVSPLTSYVAAYWPPLTSLLFPLTDPNMGALFRFPPGMIAVGLALLRRPGWRATGAVPAALTAAALLAIVSQQPNMNQGGNPDFSRYAVWLLPLALPWLLDADRSQRPATRAVGATLLLVSAGWTITAFLPSRPESYRYPTPLATWLWTRHPAWTAPRPEAFAERTSHREPAVVPTATPGCEKVLLYEGGWPASCPPGYAEVPTSCDAARTWCYADAHGFGMHTVRVVGEVASYRPVVHDRTWRAGDPAASWVAGLVAGLQPGAPPEARLSVRGAWDVRWTQLWRDDRRVVVYARDAGQGARLALRHARPVTLVVRTPGRIDETRQAGPADTPTVVALPAGPHVVVEVRVQ